MNNEAVSIPLDILRSLAPMAEQMGISLPGVARFAPVFDLEMPIRALALDMGRLLARQNIFLKSGEIVTVNPISGACDLMTAARFVGWIEEFCTVKHSGRGRKSMGREDASLVLAQDIFRSCLRPLIAVHLMRLPVLDGEGKPRWLEPGYDAESQIYTVETISYELDWTLDRSREWLNKHGEGYPWSWPDEERPHIENNRSWAVQIAAMVGMYCRAFFKPGTTRPMITFIGNQPGTGKSTLVAMILIPVFGHASATKTPKDDSDMDKELETAANTAAPYLFFDDIGRGIFSNPLNRFITASSHSGRNMGGNNSAFRALAQTQVFATGNDIKLSPDLMRRSLVAELFLAGEVRDQHHDLIISPNYLARPEVTAGFLSALCGMVNNWAETQRLPHPRPLESFEEWTGIVGSIVQLGMYMDPLSPPDLSSGGSEDEDEMKLLLIRVAGDSDRTKTNVFDRKELVAKAREWGLLENVVGTKDDKDLDATANKRFGRQLQKWRGRELVDSKGRKFRFGHRKKNVGASYPLTFLT